MKYNLNFDIYKVFILPNTFFKTNFMTNIMMIKKLRTNHRNYQGKFITSPKNS